MGADLAVVPCECDMSCMRALAPSWLVRLPALLAVLAVDVAWPSVRALGQRVASWPLLARLHHTIGRLPVAVALPLFLVPEACSRSGWVVSAWLVLHGEPWRALAIYVATKLIAGTLALWICSACLPVLLRVRAFAAVHGAMMQVQRGALSWLRNPTSAGAGGVVGWRRPGRFTAAMADIRARRAMARSSAANPAPATPSAPTDPSRTK